MITNQHLIWTRHFVEEVAKERDITLSPALKRRMVAYAANQLWGLGEINLEKVRDMFKEAYHHAMGT